MKRSEFGEALLQASRTYEELKTPNKGVSIFKLAGMAARQHGLMQIEGDEDKSHIISAIRMIPMITTPMGVVVAYEAAWEEYESRPAGEWRSEESGVVGGASQKHLPPDQISTS